MTNNEIIRLAQNKYGIYAFTAESLAEFSALVADAEREACAKVCEQLLLKANPYDRHEGIRWCADAIRARGEE